MGEDRACKPDDPVMKAWESYKADDGYATRRAKLSIIADDALWGAFLAGFEAGQQPQAVVPKPDKTRWPQPGDWMKFLGKNGYDSEARKVFSTSSWYQVDTCSVGDDFSHGIKFKGIAGYWNGVMFERCYEDGSPIITVNTIPMSQILGYPKDEPKWAGFRPAKRPDGWPTRNAVEWWSDGEKAIAEAMRVIEHIPGGSPALTDAVTLLAKARARVADHVEGVVDGKPAVPMDAIAATLAHDARPDKLVCNVVPLADKPDRVGCMSCGNTWAASLGVTGCVQGALDRLRAEHEKAIEHGADQWRAKDLAQARADRLWKAMKEITEVTGPGSYLRGLAAKALREDATRIAGVVEPAPGPGRDECDGLPETAMRGQDERPKPWQIKDPLSEDGVECWAACGCPVLEHNPGFCPLANHLETVGDAKEFGECSPQTMMYMAPASTLSWVSCGCPVTAHPMDQCTAAPKFVAHHDRRAEEIRKRASAMQDLPDADPIECPSCRHVGSHAEWCIVSNPQGSRIMVVDPAPPRMVQIEALHQIGGLGLLYALDDRGRIWTRQVGTVGWHDVALPDGFEP